MNQFKIRVEELPPMRVAYYRAYSTSPELEAVGTLWAWAESKGLTTDPESVRRFGFNNPPPWGTEGPEYGYESWIKVGPAVEPEGEIRIKEFPGSLCAVTSIERLAQIGAAWEYLYQWCQNSQEYQHADMDGLEECLSPIDTPEADLAFNLWLPIIPLQE
jgi:DNA gyrase inhibitor GyrI